MPNKQIVLGGIAGLIILLGIGGLFLYNRSKPSPGASQTTNEAQVESENKSSNGSLLDLISMGKTQECTFSYTDEEGDSTSGKAYIAGDRARADVTNVRSGKETMIYMIRSGDTNYIWGPAIPNNQGIKMTLSKEDLESNTESKKYLDTSKKVDYSCKAWTQDSSMFNPSSNVKFTDLSDLMMPKTTGGAACAACNSLAGEAKTACLTQLKCN